MSTLPPPYDRQATFTSFSTEPAPTVGQDLEAEFSAVKQSQDATQARLREIQRDDGRLANLTVHPDALSNAVRALLAMTGEVRGAWLTATVYGVADTVEGPDGITYIASEQHVSGVFANDLSAGKWLSIDSGTILDAQLRADLISDDAAKGTELVGHATPYSPAPAAEYLKYTSDILNGLEVPIDIFLRKNQISAIRAGTSTYDASTDFQTAFSAASIRNGIHLLVPHGRYNLPTFVRTFNDNVHLRGVGRPKLNIGEGQAAGYQVFRIYNNNFSASGLQLESLNRTHCFYVQPQSAVALTGFRFENLEGSGLFYMVRCDGAVDRLIYDVLVRGCKNVAPIGVPCGHFMVDFGVGIQYIGNSIRYGNNSSGYGIADSKNIAVVGNIERLLEDTAGAVEAACQIEDSDLANAVIQGNSFEHDIWISGSNGVTVEGNSCRRMRVSVGNVDGHDVKDVLFSGNRAAQIHVAAFGGSPPERIKARFVGNTLNPTGRTVNGAAISSLLYAEGTYITELELRGNTAASDASTNGVVASRSATTAYRFYDNDFGSLAHSVSGGAVGKLYESGNRNKITKTGNGYIDVFLSVAPTIATGVWTALPLTGETTDVNAEWSGAVFTPKEAGTYSFSGIMTPIPTAAGNQMGFRLTKAGVEVARLNYMNAQGTNSQGMPLRADDQYLAAGESLQLEFFHQGTSTQFTTGANVNNFQIKRVD